MDQDIVFEKLFNRSTTDQDNNIYLKNISEQHPYFAPAHYFLLKQTRVDDQYYAEHATKAALFFNNPLYLQFRLNEKNIQDHVVEPQIIPDVATTFVPPSTIVETKVEEKEEMLFEPLHASDYFASQGIKLSDDALGADKLGKQLKSFTAWLKTMKKVHPDKLPTVNAASEIAVQTLAEKSNTDEEIVTEAMAEAFILQGKSQKATNIYHKLSLLNPTKSAYFAAKIESLNT